MRVTEERRPHERPGRRPTTVYVGAQHAREWITPEMVRRLLDHVLDRLRHRRPDHRDRRQQRAVVHPGRQPRRLRLHATTSSGCGARTCATTTATARSRPATASTSTATSRPAGATTTRARRRTSAARPTAGRRRRPSRRRRRSTRCSRGSRPSSSSTTTRPPSCCCTASAGRWRRRRPTTCIYEAMAGNDADGSAIPGYDPDISAELYTTNGDTDSHMQEAYGTLGFTPEMSTCETASAESDDDEWRARGLRERLQLPRRRGAWSRPSSRRTSRSPSPSPSRPPIPTTRCRSSASTRRTSSSTRSTSPTAIRRPSPSRPSGDLARPAHELPHQRRARAQRPRRREWAGGERYGFENDDYYAEFRGEVERRRRRATRSRCGSRGDARRDPRRAGPRSRASTSRTRSRSDTGNAGADHRQRGLHRRQPDVPEPAGRRAEVRRRARRGAARPTAITPDVWDVDAQGVPHDLGVLSHYAAVRVVPRRQPADPGRRGRPHRAAVLRSERPPRTRSVAERQQYLTIAVRDYLNEGGKLIHAGETTATTACSTSCSAALGGHLLRPRRRPRAAVRRRRPTRSATACCSPTTSRQYYLGAFDREALEAPPASSARPARWTATRRCSAARRRSTTRSTRPARSPLTSDLLPPEQFPQFAGIGRRSTTSSAVGTVTPSRASSRRSPTTPTRATCGSARTFDLTGGHGRRRADVRGPAGLVDRGGLRPRHRRGPHRRAGRLDDAARPQRQHRPATCPAECEAGFYIGLHPNLLDVPHARRPVHARRRPGRGTRSPASPAGWQPVAFDLSAYAGQQVEIVVSYVTDPVTGGSRRHPRRHPAGHDGRRLEAEGFEDGLGAWPVLGAAGGLRRQRHATGARPPARRHHGRRRHRGHAAARLRHRAAREPGGPGRTRRRRPRTARRRLTRTIRPRTART